MGTMTLSQDVLAREKDVWIVLHSFISSECLLSCLLFFHSQIEHFVRGSFEWGLIAIYQLKLKLNKTYFFSFSQNEIQNFFPFHRKEYCQRNGANTKKIQWTLILFWCVPCSVQSKKAIFFWLITSQNWMAPCLLSHISLLFCLVCFL